MKDNEKEKWKDIKPEMMSDEEVLPDGTIERKRLSWRSQELDDFCCTLDARADAFSKTAKKTRVLGSPVECAPPAECPSWMLNREEHPNPEEEQEEN